MQNVTLRSILSATALSLVAGLSANAVAGQLEEIHVRPDASGVRTVRLQYSPSDLATDEGRNELYARIDRSANAVCGPLDRLQADDLRARSRNRQCYKQARDTAINQVNAGRGQVAVIGG